jgi:hypothetical protein
MKRRNIPSNDDSQSQLLKKHGEAQQSQLTETQPVGEFLTGNLLFSSLFYLLIDLLISLVYHVLLFTFVREWKSHNLIWCGGALRH